MAFGRNRKTEQTKWSNSETRLALYTWTKLKSSKLWFGCAKIMLSTNQFRQGLNWTEESIPRLTGAALTKSIRSLRFFSICWGGRRLIKSKAQSSCCSLCGKRQIKEYIREKKRGKSCHKWAWKWITHKKNRTAFSSVYIIKPDILFLKKPTSTYSLMSRKRRKKMGLHILYLTS